MKYDTCSAPSPSSPAMAFASTFSGLSLLPTDRTLHVYMVNYQNHATSFGSFDTKKTEVMSTKLITEVTTSMASGGPIYLTADTYQMLCLHHKLVPEEIITGVFPWPAEEGVAFIPTNDKSTDTICRRAAYYYLALNRHQIRNPDGKVITYGHRAANTLTYRSSAYYHNMKREDRAKHAPVDPANSIFQFDWSAAEWVLILEHLGCPVPEGDAYGMLSQVAPRETVKNIVLPHIYGSTKESLYARHGDQQVVDTVIREIAKHYPQVLAWSEDLNNRVRYVDFEGFKYDLGETPYKRPNHWAQTALQLCKWELMSRLAAVGAHSMACGDLHDQLIFDVGPQDGAAAQAAIQEIKKPAFGKYRLVPKFKFGRTWQ